MGNGVGNGVGTGVESGVEIVVGSDVGNGVERASLCYYEVGSVFKAVQNRLHLPWSCCLVSRFFLLFPSPPPAPPCPLPCGKTLRILTYY